MTRQEEVFAAEPGGWNRIIINGEDLAAEVARLRQAHLHFRNDIVAGPGGPEILLDDLPGNPIELFQPAQSCERTGQLTMEPYWFHGRRHGAQPGATYA